MRSTLCLRALLVLALVLGALATASVAAADGGSGSSGHGSGSSGSGSSGSGSSGSGSGGSPSDDAPPTTSGDEGSTTPVGSSEPGSSGSPAPGGDGSPSGEPAASPVAAVPPAATTWLDVRTSSRCGARTVAVLHLQANGRVIRVRFEIAHDRPGARWQIAVVHERRLAWKGSAQASSPAGWLAVDRRLGDFPGSDDVSVRAWGPGGAGCQASASIGS